MPLRWRGGRVAEGAPLLREYRGNLIEGSNPSLSAIIDKSPACAGLFLVSALACSDPRCYLEVPPRRHPGIKVPIGRVGISAFSLTSGYEKY